MATKKTGTKVSAEDKAKLQSEVTQSIKNAEKQGKQIIEAKQNAGKSTTGLRIGAIILWVVGLAFEIVAILILKGKIPFGDMFNMNIMVGLIGALVLDLAAVIIGSQLWKKANHIHPASEANKFTFWLWNNMGVIAAAICFAPIIILLLNDKNMDKKSKTIVTVVAVIALLIAGVSSYDFNPISQEDLADQVSEAEAMGLEKVYYTEFGNKIHYFPDCQYIKSSFENNNVYEGTMEQAHESGLTEVCSKCASRAAEIIGTGDPVDDVVDNVLDEVVDEVVEEVIDDAA